ncbi:hypothetical protein GAY28_19040 [Azospirillum brasilense]|nr:hypothetical protein [Azospirillum brasilense]
MVEPAQHSLFRQLVTREFARIRRLVQMDPLFIPNSEWSQFEVEGGPIPLMMVGADNPGIEEKAAGVYLCRNGVAGYGARGFLDAVFGAEAVEKGRVFVFDKSSYHTPVTKNLEDLILSPRTNPSLLKALVDDQEANGRAVAAIAATLGIPVLTVGRGGRPEVFRVYRDALIAEAAARSYTQGRLFRKTLRSAFFTAPHFSRNRAFQKSKLPGWNQRLAEYVIAWPTLVTAKGNPSPVAIRDIGGQAAAKDYMLRALLAG